MPTNQLYWDYGLCPVCAINFCFKLKNQRGLGLLEVLGALAVSSILMTSYTRMATDSGKQIKGTATAQNFKQVYDAGSRYIKDNYGVLLTSTPATITTGMLVSTGYLPTTYSGLNPYAQSTTISVTMPSANNLQAVVMTSGGTAIPEANAPVIASKVGSAGAYFPVSTPNTAKGAYGGWSLDLTGSSPGAGHLAGLVFYNNGDLVSDYLQRHQVPGHPEVNEMFTAINMNSNDINSANNVNTANVNATNSLNANNATLAAGNSLHIGSSIYYGDGANSATRQSGGLYVQSQDGSSTRWYVDGSGNTSQAGSANVSGSANVAGSATVSGAVTTQYLSDANNGGYYVDPNGTSRTNYTVQDNNYVNGWTQADTYYDRYNNGYYVQPGRTNRLAQVNADNQSTIGNNAANTFQVNGVATAGQGCSPNGLVAQNGTGALLSCVSGVWKGGGGLGTGYQLYQCPINYAAGGGAWGSYGCVGQIGINSTCSNIIGNSGVWTYACTPISNG